MKFYNLFVVIRFYFKGIKVTKSKNFICIRKGTDELRLNHAHKIMLNDTLNNYNFYFSAVYPKNIKGFSVVDYSKPSYQKVKSFDIFKVFFSSFAEPVSTIKQYLNFANLKSGDVAIDVGAYSGLSSIFFKQKVGPKGEVIAIEADPSNFKSLTINIDNFKKTKNLTIKSVAAAYWSNNKGIYFSSEGNMSSSASEVIGSDRGKSLFVKTITLKEIINSYNLKKIDFIKVDIEGAELQFVQDPLLKRYFPRLVIECHIVNSVSTENMCREKLLSIGYDVKKILQVGYPLPLLYCEKI